MAAATQSRSPSIPPFNAVNTSVNSTKDEVESPSLSNSNALARYEFEPGRQNDGTKILMVEWEDDATTLAANGSWTISWEGKSTVLPAGDNNKEQIIPMGSGNPLHRMYFLLPLGSAVPQSVALKKGSIHWRTNPLPAIFPPELGTTARQAGKKGVLHTIWAKKRLQALQREIDAEAKNGTEGIGLTMVLQEKEWIENNFGVSSRPSGLNIATGTSGSGAPLSPSSPRSPGGGRLFEKLKGLNLRTGEQDLNTGASSSDRAESNPLSPEQSDVAVSSFAIFKGLDNPNALAAKPAQPPTQRKMASYVPPPEVVAQQQAGLGLGGMGSLNAFSSVTPGTTTSNVSDANVPAFETRSPKLAMGDDDDDDALFAMPISPRSPEMKASPFSFAASDTKRYDKTTTA